MKDAFCFTSQAKVWNSMSPFDVDGIRDDTIEGFSHHGKVHTALDDLQRPWIHREGIFQEEIDGKPREASEALDKVAQGKKM